MKELKKIAREEYKKKYGELEKEGHSAESNNYLAKKYTEGFLQGVIKVYMEELMNDYDEALEELKTF